MLTCTVVCMTGPSPWNSFWVKHGGEETLQRCISAVRLNVMHSFCLVLGNSHNIKTLQRMFFLNSIEGDRKAERNFRVKIMVQVKKIWIWDLIVKDVKEELKKNMLFAGRSQQNGSRKRMSSDPPNILCQKCFSLSDNFQGGGEGERRLWNCFLTSFPL